VDGAATKALGVRGRRVACTIALRRCPLSLVRTPRGVAIAAATLIALPSIGIGSARASGPISVASLPLASCGAATSVLPEATSVTDDGWTVLQYRIDGVLNRQYIPPVGFDPSTMSDQDIQRHHLPARPSGTAEQRDWASNVGLLAGWHSRNLCVGPANGLKMGTQRYSAGWGGDEVRYQPSYRFDGVQGHYTQPALGTACGSNSAVSSWVGIGGDDTPNNDYPFIQAGTTALGPALSPSGYLSFYEIFTLGLIPSDRPPVYMGNDVEPGDAMYAEVDWDSSLSMAYSYVSDSTQQWGWLASSDAPLLWTGISAEWVDELPSGPMAITLTNYSTPGYPGWTSWTQLKTHHTNSAPGAWTPAYNEPTEWWIMITSDGQPYHQGRNIELSQTTGTYADSHMKNHWHHC
jgi:hypothetical protein